MDACLLEVFWFSLISAFLLGWTVYTLVPSAPDFLQDLLHYGKCKVVRDDRSWLRVFDIPKRWFSHFYYEGVVWNSFILLVTLLSFVGGVPAFWWLQEGLSFISDYPLDPPTADHVSVLLALILLEFQIIRRLWECLYVSIFSDVSVHLVHYLLGLVYYLAVPISIIAEGPKLDGTRLSLSDVRWSHVVGTALFIWSFWQQNKAHIILANLRKDKRGYVVTRGHKIPYGGWFEYVSNPHYLAELLMYLSIIIVLGGEHYLSWVIQGETLESLLDTPGRKFRSYTVADVLKLASLIDKSNKFNWDDFTEWHRKHFPQLSKAKATVHKYIQKLRSGLLSRKKNKARVGDGSVEAFQQMNYIDAVKPASSPQHDAAHPPQPDPTTPDPAQQCSNMMKDIRSLRRQMQKDCKEEREEAKKKRQELLNRSAQLSVGMMSARRELIRVKNSTVSRARYDKKEKECDAKEAVLKKAKKTIRALRKENAVRALRRRKKSHADHQKKWRRERQQLLQKIRRLKMRMMDRKSGFKEREIKLHKAKRVAQTKASDRKKALEKCDERAKCMENKIRKLQEDNSLQAEKVARLEETIEMTKDVQKVKTRTRDDDRAPFSDGVKQCVMELQGMQVGSNKVPGVIETVARNLFDVKLSTQDLPQKSTVCNLAAQAYYLGRRQVAEKLADAKHWGLHTDGTSRDGLHVLNFQCVTDSDQLSLGYLPVAEETASSVLESTQAVIKDLSVIHPQNNPSKIQQQLLQGLRTTMTDRCSVMKLFTGNLKKWKEEELEKCQSKEDKMSTHAFFCTAHYLLGLSHHTSQALREYQDSLQMMYGLLGRDNLSEFKFWRVQEPAVIRFVRTVCEALGPRGDQKSGCRGDWTSWLQSRDTSSSIISFRSNRFNNMFLGGATVYHHHRDIQEFMSSGVLTKDNKLLRSIAADVASPPLLAGARALGIFFHRVSGPMWDMIQSPKVHILDMYKYVQILHQQLKVWVEDASTLVLPHTCALFADFPPEESPIFTALYDSKEDALTQELLEVISASSLYVTEKQLGDFLQQGKFGSKPTEIDRQQTKHTQKSNLIGENDFGDFDYSTRQKPNARLLHHSSVLMTKRNHTFGWLDGKAQEEKEQLLKDAQRMAPKVREADKNQWEQMEKTKQAILLDNKKRNDEKEKNRISTMQELIDKVHEHGGPCRTAEDIDRITNGLSETRKCSILKDELQYNRKVLGVAGKAQEFSVSCASKKLSSNALKTKLSVIIARVTQSEPEPNPRPGDLVDFSAPERQSKVSALKSAYMEKVNGEQERRNRVDSTSKTQDEENAEEEVQAKKSKKVTQKKKRTAEAKQDTSTTAKKQGKKGKKVSQKKKKMTDEAEVGVQAIKEPVSYRPGEFVAVWYSDNNDKPTWYPGSVVEDGADTCTLTFFHPVAGYIAVELGLCGWITHNWYRTKFDNYPSSRSILIPYIF